VTCTHHECRCARANELAALFDRYGRVQYLLDAIRVHEQEVVCRQAPAPKEPQ
jgi:hypothetical protein